MKLIKFVRNVVLFILTAIFLAFMLLVSYCMPHYSAAVISGVEVKRMNENENTPNNKEVKTLARDVYFVQTYDPKDQKSVTVYRNEDTRFSFLFILSLIRLIFQPRSKFNQSASGSEILWLADQFV